MPRPDTMTAAYVMTPSPRTCSPFSSVLEAVMIFREADCGAVPVVEDGHAVGVVTDRDIALALPDHEADLIDLPVSEIMTRGAVTVTPDTPIDQLVEKFGEHGVRRLLVADRQGQLVGIVSWSDVAPYAADGELGRAVTEVVERP
ncbi:MAG: CBS domain-containing protein [Isosphaeraceae bacterium]|nr:CBS domain-containing protein [Isosphaeraceae bacterium]